MAIDLAALRAKHEQLLQKQQGGQKNSDFLENFYSINDGENLVRLLPWRDDSQQFYAETAIHRIPTSLGEKPQTKNVHCPKVVGDPCPICELYYGLWKTGSSTDEALARQIKPRARYYLNVLNRETNEVKILSVGMILFGKFTSAILDPDYGDITDPKTGHDFKIVKYMEGGWPKYDQSAPRPKPTPLAKTDGAIAGIFESLHDIHALVKREDNENLKRIAEGVATAGFYNVVNNYENNTAPATATGAVVQDDNEEVEDNENYLKKLRT